MLVHLSLTIILYNNNNELTHAACSLATCSGLLFDGEALKRMLLFAEAK